MYTLSRLIILLTLYLGYQQHLDQNYDKCIADEIKSELFVTETNDINELKANPFVPLEIYYDYTTLNQQASSVDPDYYVHIKSVLEEVKALFKKLIQGRKHDTNLVITKCASQVTISDLVKTTGVDANIVIFPFFDFNMPQGALAYAATCILKAWPIAGLIGLNPTLSTYTRPNSFLSSLYIVTHEMTHALVFANNLYQYYRDEEFNIRKQVVTSKEVNGVVRQFIMTPRVLAYAKQHYKCDSLIGVELENQGGAGTAGSHWETRTMYSDYMVGSIADEMFISEISLALFEDSGWYKANYYTGGLFKFGKHEGCKFLNEKCIQNQKSAFKRFFCDTAGPFCSSGRTSKGVCYIGNYPSIPPEYQYFSDPKRGGHLYADYCPLSYPYNKENNLKAKNCMLGDVEFKSEGELMSSTSWCFISSLTTSPFSIKERTICYPIECNFDTNTTTVTVLDNKITCPKAGGRLETPRMTGYLNCPMFNELCTSLIPCNDLLDCINKKSLPILDSEIVIPLNPLYSRYINGNNILILLAISVLALIN